MDQFPPKFDRQTCMETVDRMQISTMRIVREEFHNEIIQGINKCNTSVTLHFPPNLWPQHRHTITLELLQRFQTLEITVEVNYTKDRQPVTVTRTVTLEDPPNSDSGTITHIKTIFN